MGPFNERLASLPAVPRRTTAGDGTEPQGSAGLSLVKSTPQQGLTADEQQSQIAPPPGKTIKDADPQVKFKTVEQLIRSQDPLARNRWAIDTHFGRVRAAVPFARLEKIPNQSVWVAKMPNGMSKESTAAVPNKADDLCNKVEDTLMADPAKPDPSPHVNDESAREAGDLAAQFLLLDGGEAGTNDPETYRWALNNAFSRSASILHYLVDPAGGGYQPLQKMAHPQAQDPQNPLVGPDGMQATDPILRFVSAPSPEAPAGQFVDDAMQADRVWLPKILIERHRRESVRTFPPTADVDRAVAVIFICSCRLSDARSQWPETVGKMDATQLQALASWKPVMSDQTVAYAFKASADTGASGPSLDDVGSLSPLLQRMMFSYRLYVKSTPEYDGGYWLDVTGAEGGTVLGEGDLEYTVKLPTGGKEKRCTEIPAVLIRPRQDVLYGDPLGFPFIERFAGASEADATLLAAFMDVCDNMLHPHVFIESTTAINEDEWFDRSLPTIVNPGGHMPTYEQFPNLPPILPLVQHLDKRQDVSSGLTATAQGLDVANADSGTAKNAEIRQAQIFLTGAQQNLHAGMMRGWRIKCQLVMKHYSTPQLMQYSGEGNSAEEQWWTGEDFAGVDRVGIQPGTGSMMTPEGKAQYIAFLQSQQWMLPDQAAEVALPSIRMDLGLPTEPVIAALEREVTAWLKGPPEGWVQAQQQYMQAKAAYDQQQAQMLQQQQAAQIQQQQTQANAPVVANQQQEHQNAIDQERQKADIGVGVEKEKTQLQMQVADQAHRHAMEQKQADVAIEQAKPRPEPVQPSHQPGQLGPPPTVVVSPPDLSAIAHAMEQMAQMIAQLAQKETPAPIIQVAHQPPDVHVHPMVKSPDVHVTTPPPHVTVEAAKHEPPSAPAKKKKRKPTIITSPKGEKFTVEHGGEED
jgi:hypothetical protein